MPKPTHIFFDLDNTLTPSRAEILPQHRPLFEALCEKVDVIVVSGGRMEQYQKQLPIDPKGRYYVLSQQGNYAVDKDGSPLWHEVITPEQEAVAREAGTVFIEAFQEKKATPIPDQNDLFENRGSILAVSVVGFHAQNEVKYAADPDQSIRRSVLTEHPEEVQKLQKVGLQIMPAGSTTFDILLDGKNKGFNIRRLLERKTWKTDDCLYVGDALFPGGNDESVIGVIPTQPVKDPNETFTFIQQHLL